MNRRIPQISSTKGRQIFLNQQLQDNLDLFAKFQAHKFGGRYEPSDILCHLLSDEKRLQEIQPKVTSDSSKAHFRMTTQAWDNLDATVARTGLKIETVIEEISAGLFRDREFAAFKANVQVEVQAPKETPKKSRKAQTQAVPSEEIAE